MITQIHHKKNELLEVESYKDKECTQAFDFTNAENIYLEKFDIDVLFELSMQAINNTIFISSPCTFSKTTLDYLKQCWLDNCPNSNFVFLDDITLDLSKYIPKDNAVLFLSEEVYNEYTGHYEGCNDINPKQFLDEHHVSCLQYNNDGSLFVEPIKWWGEEGIIQTRKCLECGQVDIEQKKMWVYPCECEEPDREFYGYKHYTIFLPHGTQSELQKANEVAKELREKYGVEEVNLVVLHNFQRLRVLEDTVAYIKIDSTYTVDGYIPTAIPVLLLDINKIITTNSTGILKPEDSNERLQVIDCKELFEEYLKENN